MSDYTRHELQEYYATKASAYEDKYRSGGITHIHTGHFAPREWPKLFGDQASTPKSSEDHLRRVMTHGQDETIRRLFALLPTGIDDDTTVLDCGAGHGGTSIYLAERFGCQVTSATISPRQAEIIRATAERAGMETKIHPTVGDIRAGEFPSGPYNLIFGIDSFCQIGSLDITLTSLREVQDDGDHLLISDSFMNSMVSAPSTKSTFDSYWRSAISTDAQLIHALNAAGYSLLRFEDTTQDQVPFWRLSAQYTSSLLEKMTDSPRTPALVQSREFHQFLLKAYGSGHMKYLQILAVAI